MMSVIRKDRNIVNDAIIKDIAEAVQDLEYGTVEIKVHGSKIIQIEVTRKRRFDSIWNLEEGGGI